MRRRDFVGLVYRSGVAALLADRLPGFSQQGRGANQPAVRSANVKAFGARGDGRTNDTAAFTLAIRSLGGRGGTVVVPKGVYLIDPTQSVILVDNVALRFDEDAVLRAIPVANGSSAVILARRAQNVTITGGMIVGEALAHLGRAGEWGMGIELYGCSNVNLDGVSLRECWGDGIYIGADRGQQSTNVTIRNCSSRANRRQGLSVTGCVGALIERCDFSDTAGTLPQSGIDLEPKGRDKVSDVTISDCTMLRNAGFGFTVGSNVSRVVLRANHVVLNKQGGLQISRASSVTADSNVIQRNGRQGILVIDGADGTTISSNTICANGWVSPGTFDNVFLDKGASNTRINDNTFLCGVGTDPARYDVRTNSADCRETLVSGNRFRPTSGGKGGLDDHGRGTKFTPLLSTLLLQGESPSTARECEERRTGL